MSIKYPVYVHRGDAERAHGITVPDFPGCFSAADDWGDIPAMVQEAVEVYCEGEGMALPSPSRLDQLRGLPEYRGGEWLLVAINLQKRRQPA